MSGDAGMPNIKQNLDSITVVGFTIYDGKERPPAGTGPEGSPELHWQGGGASRCTTAAMFWVSVPFGVSVKVLHGCRQLVP